MLIGCVPDHIDAAILSACDTLSQLPLLKLAFSCGADLEQVRVLSRPSGHPDWSDELEMKFLLQDDERSCIASMSDARSGRSPSGLHEALRPQTSACESLLEGLYVASRYQKARSSERPGINAVAVQDASMIESFFKHGADQRECTDSVAELLSVGTLLGRLCASADSFVNREMKSTIPSSPAQT